MCPISFALGRWRAERGKARLVRLAAAICAESYAAGFEVGAARRPGRR